MERVILTTYTIEEISDILRRIVKEELEKIQLRANEPRYLSRKEACKQLHITLPTLNEYTKKGIIKGSRVGVRVLYLESDIQEAVKGIPTLKYRR